MHAAIAPGRGDDPAHAARDHAASSNHPSAPSRRGSSNASAQSRSGPRSQSPIGTAKPALGRSHQMRRDFALEQPAKDPFALAAADLHRHRQRARRTPRHGGRGTAHAPPGPPPSLRGRPCTGCRRADSSSASACIMRSALSASATEFEVQPAESPAAVAAGHRRAAIRLSRGSGSTNSSSRRAPAERCAASCATLRPNSGVCCGARASACGTGPGAPAASGRQSPRRSACEQRRPLVSPTRRGARPE